MEAQLVPRPGTALFLCTLVLVLLALREAAYVEQLAADGQRVRVVLENTAPSPQSNSTRGPGVPRRGRTRPMLTAAG